MKNKKIFFVMGVSGCGKSSVGESISTIKSYRYADADDYHPPENVAKMRNSIPLTDNDRLPWLKTLNELATGCIKSNEALVVACSCLKPEYRQILQQSIKDYVVFIYLKGSFEIISERMKNRGGHYFNGDEMLMSQFDVLVEPTNDEQIDYVEVSIDDSDIDGVVDRALDVLSEANYV
ncbi:gluconokinase [Vibrio sp. JC009]|uniref:gluconokinase n=1 Tax=Vibrio sp. JC009 TaxID=2912314 RepID=UPI0023B1BB0A|nr:gluconokinase [Vibrio sp. JC009]WED24235.1 gluconokinase [Vibrio sp. JC009]